MAEEKQTTPPTHIAYHVREGGEGKSHFNRIGAMFPHKDGQGYSLSLSSVPIDGKVTLRTLKSRDERAAPDKARDREHDR